MTDFTIDPQIPARNTVLVGGDERMLKHSLLATGLTLTIMSGVASLPVEAEPVLQGAVCSERVHELTSNIQWYKDLKEAETAAQQQGKLVFWMHMLGKIDGAT
jgi:hypothetical protein